MTVPGALRPDPVRGRPRLLRAVALGGSSLALAVGAHLVGGGQLPGPAALAAMVVLLGLMSVTLTARRLRFGLLVTVLAVVQLLEHLVLRATSGPELVLSSTAPAHLHGGGLTMAGGQAMSPDAMAGVSSLSAVDWPMLAGHILATLATAWLLARGEARLWGLADRIVEAATAAPASWPRPTPRSAVLAFPTSH